MSGDQPDVKYHPSYDTYKPCVVPEDEDTSGEPGHKELLAAYDAALKQFKDHPFAVYCDGKGVEVTGVKPSQPLRFSDTSQGDDTASAGDRFEGLKDPEQLYRHFVQEDLDRIEPKLAERWKTHLKEHAEDMKSEQNRRPAPTIIQKGRLGTDGRAVSWKTAEERYHKIASDSLEGTGTTDEEIKTASGDDASGGGGGGGAEHNPSSHETKRAKPTVDGGGVRVKMEVEGDARSEPEHKPIFDVDEHKPIFDVDVVLRHEPELLGDVKNGVVNSHNDGGENFEELKAPQHNKVNVQRALSNDDWDANDGIDTSSVYQQPVRSGTDDLLEQHMNSLSFHQDVDPQDRTRTLVQTYAQHSPRDVAPGYDALLALSAARDAEGLSTLPPSLDEDDGVSGGVDDLDGFSAPPSKDARLTHLTALLSGLSVDSDIASFLRESEHGGLL